MTGQTQTVTKIGLAGCGALGTIVAKALTENGGLKGYELIGIADLNPPPFAVPHMSFKELAEQGDLIVECLPANIVPDLAKPVLEQGKTLLLISACALLLFPEIKDWAEKSTGRIIVPSGALAGLDAVLALKQSTITSATIASTKPPKGFKNAPYILEKNIDLDKVTEKTLIFSGTAPEAAKAFPANVNVAASLSLAGPGPENVTVEVWADPEAKSNFHEITVSGSGSTIRARVENTPDPSNPKSSMLAGYSIVAALKKMKTPVTVI